MYYFCYSLFPYFYLSFSILSYGISWEMYFVLFAPVAKMASTKQFAPEIHADGFVCVQLFDQILAVV